MLIKVGIAGYGRMGKIRASAIDNNPDAKLTHIYDIELDNIDRADVEICNNYQQLLDADIDAVFIAGYVKNSAEYTIRAINAGKHVFCEKPPAINLTEMDGVKESFEASDRILKYGFNHRFHYSVMEAKKVIDAGEIGDIILMRGVYGKAGSIDFEKNWRNYKEYSGGGILIDQGIHMLDLFGFLSSEKLICTGSMVRTLNWDIGCEDNVMAMFEADSGVICSLHSSATQWKHTFMLEIIGKKGHIVLDGILSSTMSYSPEKLVVGLLSDERNDISMGKPAEKTYEFDKDDSWGLELSEFIQAIKKEGTVKNGSIYDSIDVMRLLGDVYAKNQLGVGK